MDETGVTSFEEAGIDIAPEVLEKLLRLGCNGPLKSVEDVILPEPLILAAIRTHPDHERHKRGRKPFEEWIKEVRRIWRHINDEEQLAKSWLALLTPVQDLAASNYSGRAIDNGVVLQYFIKQALAEAQKLDVDEKIHELFMKYPQLKIKKIASHFGLTREHFSRYYCSKAARLLTRILQRIIYKIEVKNTTIMSTDTATEKHR